MSSSSESAAGGQRPRARRSPTPEQLRAWRLFVETSEALKYVVETSLQEQSGVSSGDYAVMVALSDSPGGRMRSSQLARQINWERSRLSHHLGRMERRGLITRESVSGDSRGAEVMLSAEGARLYRVAFGPHMHTVHDAFASVLTAEQIAAIEDAMLALRAHHSLP
jgi:DNA-binding MarR family transcriptional regulator